MTPKGRKTPLRTCVACRAVRPKRELVRVVRSPDGHVQVDPSGKLSGRGASVCPAIECCDRALKTGALARALQVGLDTEQTERLRGQFEELLSDEEGGAHSA